MSSPEAGQETGQAQASGSNVAGPGIAGPSEHKPQLLANL